MLARHPDRTTPWLRIIRLAGVVGITVTGVVHFFLLRPLLDLEGADWAADKLLHMVVPVLAVLVWVLAGPRPAFRTRDAVLAMAWPAAWTVWTLVVGEITGWLPYPFMDADAKGWGAVAVACLGVAGAVPRGLRPVRVAGPSAAARPAAYVVGPLASLGGMEFRYLGNSGLKISEITYGNWLTHGSQVENDVATQCVRAALDDGITHLRHRRRLRQHGGRDGARRGAQGRAARVAGDLHQGLLAHRPQGQERHRPVAQAHHGVDQRLADAAADRLRRPLPGPPLRRARPRSRRRCRPSPTSSARARRSTSASASGPPTRSAPAHALARELGFQLISNQPQYSMLWRVIEDEVVPTSRGARHLARSSGRPIAQGVLTGKYLPGQAAARGLARHRRQGRRRHDQALHERRRPHRACRSSSRSPTSSA